ncbi:chitin-binding domain protein cbd-1-like isoform X1 [Vespula squamosa]|uniref:Chitin-binding domain protein cbd-1-like isoform X1 n=1 Tax=Vespula squamosa TaxID=30214 RepID=A0ABD2AIG0_VESSQ
MSLSIYRVRGRDISLKVLLNSSFTMEGSFGWVAVFAIILAAVNLEAAPRQAVPTVCPSEDSLEETVLLAHESDCSKFYVCFLGEKILKECPYRNSRGDRLHFNPLLQVCDYPLEAGCKLQSTATKQLTSVAVPLTKQAPSQLTTPRNIPSSISSTNSSNQIKYKQHQCSCNLYYENINATHVLRQCPNNLCWNQDLQTCYTPELTKCTQQGISPMVDIKCTEGEYVRHECQCSLYYVCHNGLLVVQNCPGDLQWNDNKKQCTSKEEATCCKDGAYKPHQCECNLYYKCINNDYVLQKCKDGLDWDRKRNECRNPADAGCRPVCKEGDTKPHDSLCDKYFKCENNQYVQKTCPSGLHWDRKRNLCNNPLEANCPYIKRCIEGETRPHECDCNLYYKCINNNLVKQKCEVGLDWDNRNKACRKPEDAGCRPVCKEGDTKPHDSLCDKYLKCENNQYVQKTCPSGLHWDRKRNLCNNPLEANCPYMRCIEGETRPHQCDCNLYYKCINNNLVKQKCEVGLDWDNRNKACRKPEDAGCRPVCKEGDTKPHDSLCDKYFKCENNQYVQKTCPSGLHWDRKRNLCNNPLEANCPYMRPVCKEGDTKPHDSLCDKYFKCENNKYVQKTCPSGLHWDRKRNSCNNPLEANCPYKKCIDGTTYPHECQCHLYYVCKNDMLVLQECPNGKEWDRNNHICTDPANAHCPKKQPITCDEGSYKSHDKECDIYYKCISNNYVSKTCKPGLHWNRQRNLCTAPTDARCPTSSDRSCIEGFYKPHEVLCDMYYKCVNNNLVLRKCPPGLHWDRKRNICNLPTDARCPISSVRVCTEGFYKHHEEECDKYFKCENNNYVTKKCPSGLHWDRKHNICTAPIQARCLILGPESTCADSSIRPHECECSLYYICNTNRWQIAIDHAQQDKNIHLESKHENVHGFLSYKVCVQPENTKCKVTNEEKNPDALLSKRVSQSSTNIPGVPDHCPPDDYGKLVHLPHETNCSLFYKCNKGNKILQRCPPGLHYSPVMQICLLPEQAKCTSKPDNKVDGNKDLFENGGLLRAASKSSVFISTNIPGVPDHCPPDDYGKLVHLPHETNCSLFYKCNKGNKILQRCPPGLHYNPVMQICLLPEQAKCTSKPDNKVDGNQDLSENEGLGENSESSTEVPTTTTPSSRPDHCPAHDTGDVVHLPHETDCTLFYKCIEGEKIIQQCPPGLHFNAELQVCDLPEHANCTSKSENKVDGNQDLSENEGLGENSESSTEVPNTSTPSSRPDHCPAHDTGDVVHLPHETDCTLFYKCIEGEKIIQQCPPGLHFNAELQVCDLPEHANCTSKSENKVDGNQDLSENEGLGENSESSTEVPNTSTSGSIPDHCPSHDSGDVVHLPHETNCSLFYKCLEGKKIVLRCPPNLHFNPILQVCDLPEQAHCKSKPGNGGDENQELPETKETSAPPPSSTGVPTSSTSGSIPDHCPSHDSGDVVHLPHETNCSLFYKCLEGKKIVLRCPPNLHFNPILQVCDLPEQAHCKSKPGNGGDENQELPETKETSAPPPSSTGVPTSSTSGSIPDHCPSHDSGDVVHLPHETNCSLFYKCLEGKKIVLRCPPNLHFNPILQVCDLPEQAHCKSKPGNGGDENQELPETKETSAPPPSSTGVPTSSTSGSIPDHCPSHDSGDVVHLPHETNCSLFYKCLEGKKIVLRCPPNLHFNPILQVCDLPEQAHCKSKPGNGGDENQELPETKETSAPPPSSTGVPTSSTSGSIPDHCPSHDSGDVVHLPHETNCSLFYKCLEGKKIVLRCPPNLHFNPILQVCDLPEQAHCKSKPGNGGDENQELPETKETSAPPPSSTGVPTSSTSGSIPDHCPSHDSGDVVHLPHETNCSLFYKCLEGKKIVLRCPPNLHFNPILQVCDLPEQAHCKSKPGNGGDENQELPVSTETTSAPSQSSTEVPTSSTGVPTSSTPDVIPDHCPSHDSGYVVHLRHETDCTLFYKCVEGDKVLQQCPAGLHFNAVLQVCDLPEHAQCESKPGNGGDENQELPVSTETTSAPSQSSTEVPTSSTGVPTSSTPDVIPDHCPSHDSGYVVHLRHETDCTLFYKCVEGDKVLQQCPAGLHFNAVLQVCDSPGHAKCTNEKAGEEDKY